MSMENPFLASVWCSEFILCVLSVPWRPDDTYRDQRPPALEDDARGTSRRLLRTKWMGGMASTPQNTSRIDFLRLSLPYACRLYGSSLLKRAGEGTDTAVTQRKVGGGFGQTELSLATDFCLVLSSTHSYTWYA